MNSAPALAKRFPNERFLIVQYGDHQPIATRTLLGFDKSRQRRRREADAR